jgi:aspartate aminotransferase
MNFTPQAFYLYPSVAGLIGRKTSSGQVLKSDLDVSLYLLEQGVPSL